MDYRKKITLYITSIVILSLTAFLGLVFSPQAVFQRESNTPLLAGFSPVSVTKIVIEDQAALVQDNGLWKVFVKDKPYPAGKDIIESFLKDLSELKKNRKISSSSKELEAYGLDKDYHHVTIHDKVSNTFDIIVGKTDPSGKYCYVKLANKDDIWMTDRQFSHRLGLDFNTWTDLSLIPGQRKPEDLVRVSWTGSLITSSKEVYKDFELDKTLHEQSMKWQLKSSGEFPSNVLTYLEQLLNHKAASYMKSDETFDRTKSLVNLTLEWTNGEKTEIKIGAPIDKRFPLAEGDRQLWINEWSLNTLAFRPKKEDH